MSNRRCLNVLALAAGLVPTVAFAGAFTSGDLVVVRLGAGGTALPVTGGAAVFLDEYKLAGGTATLVNTVAVPATGASALTMSNTGSHDGLLNLSTNGQYLTLAGYRADVSGTTDPATTSVPRVVGRIAANGTVDTTTAITDAYSGFAIRSAASTDGTHFWVAGDGNTGTAGHDGLRYISGLGGSTSIDLDTRLANGTTPPYVNVRSAAIFGGQLYATSGSSTSIGKAAFQIGAGLPVAGPNNATLLTTDGTSLNDLYLADLSPGVAGFDTLYGSASNQIRKYSLIGGAWTLTAAITIAGGEHFTASVDGSNVSLYVTSTDHLYSVADTAGYNASGFGTVNTLLTLGADQQLRGLALAPTAVPEPGAMEIAAIALPILARRHR